MKRLEVWQLRGPSRPQDWFKILLQLHQGALQTPSSRIKTPPHRQHLLKNQTLNKIKSKMHRNRRGTTTTISLLAKLPTKQQKQWIILKSEKVRTNSYPTCFTRRLHQLLPNSKLLPTLFLLLLLIRNKYNPLPFPSPTPTLKTPLYSLKINRKLMNKQIRWHLIRRLNQKVLANKAQQQFRISNRQGDSTLQIDRDCRRSTLKRRPHHPLLQTTSYQQPHPQLLTKKTAKKNLLPANPKNRECRVRVRQEGVGQEMTPLPRLSSLKRRNSSR